MKKIIIRDFTNDTIRAVSLVSRCIDSSFLENEPLFTFTNDKERICVNTVVNKESIRFDVYKWSDKNERNRYNG